MDMVFSVVRFRIFISGMQAICLWVLKCISDTISPILTHSFGIHYRHPKACFLNFSHQKTSLSYAYALTREVKKLYNIPIKILILWVLTSLVITHRVVGFRTSNDSFILPFFSQNSNDLRFMGRCPKPQQGALPPALPVGGATPLALRASPHARR